MLRKTLIEIVILIFTSEVRIIIKIFILNLRLYLNIMIIIMIINNIIHAVVAAVVVVIVEVGLRPFALLVIVVIWCHYYVFITSRI